MQMMPLDQAEGRLVEIVARLRPDEEIVLTRDDKPIATIRAVPAHSPRAAGSGTCAARSCISPRTSTRSPKDLRTTCREAAA